MSQNVPSEKDVILHAVRFESFVIRQVRPGLTRSEIESTAEIYANAKNVIFCYGMGLTQHRHGTQVVQQLANLMLMRGQVGRPGAGICPLRGHSNVQGDRTVASPRFPTPSCSSGWKRPSASSRRMNTAIVPSTPSRP